MTCHYPYPYPCPGQGDRLVQASCACSITRENLPRKLCQGSNQLHFQAEEPYLVWPQMKVTLVNSSRLWSQGLLWCDRVILNCLSVWLFRQVSSKQCWPLHPMELCFAQRVPKWREQRSLHIFALSASMRLLGPGMAFFNWWELSLTLGGLLCSDHAVPGTDSAICSYRDLHSKPQEEGGKFCFP